MASPTTPVGGTAANAAVGRLVLEIQAGLDELVDGIVARIRDELPDFRRLPASTLARAVRGNVSTGAGGIGRAAPADRSRARGRGRGGTRARSRV